MATMEPYKPHGVIPAVLLPFGEDFAIDEAAFRSHLRDVTGVRGIGAITVNGHSSEVHACTADERKRVLDIALDEAGGRVPVIDGIYTDSSLEAARVARESERAGAAALLVLPPHSIGRGGGQKRPEMALLHFRAIAGATGLPLIAFQYPLADGYGYPLDTLLRIADEVPTLAAIKDGCYDVRLHERHIRTLQSLPRPVNVLTTHSPWLLPSLTLGCNGLLSGAGSIVADLHVALFEAVRAGDMKRAAAVNDRLYPTSQCFYADPACDMHNRMKEGLALLGRLPRAVVRPPLAKLGAAEIAAIAAALKQAGIGRDGASPPPAPATK
jgi:4-hydroxy-tetrahydrodipicolinate synthase